MLYFNSHISDFVLFSVTIYFSIWNIYEFRKCKVENVFIYQMGLKISIVVALCNIHFSVVGRLVLARILNSKALSLSAINELILILQQRTFCVPSCYHHFTGLHLHLQAHPFCVWYNKQDYNAKLSDFGLAKDGPVGDKSHVSTRIMGTYGYAAPEYIMTGKFSMRHFDMLLPCTLLN